MCCTSSSLTGALDVSIKYLSIQPGIMLMSVKLLLLIRFNTLL